MSVETNATNFYLRESLHNLPSKIKELNYNILKFNDCIKLQVTDLAAGGQQTTDLLVYLFKSYKSVKDKEFVDYIKKKKDTYDEGTDITPTALMDTALTKYNQLVQDNQWGQPTEEERKIVALTAQLEETQSKLKKLKKGKGGSGNEQSQERRGNSRNNNTSGDGNQQDGSWKKQKPRPGQKKRTYKGKEYIWCSFHEMWTSHDVNECKAKKKADEKKKKSQGDADNDNSPSDKDDSLQLAQALVNEESSFHE